MGCDSKEKCCNECSRIADLISDIFVLYVYLFPVCLWEFIETKASRFALLNCAALIWKLDFNGFRFKISKKPIKFGVDFEINWNCDFRVWDFMPYSGSNFSLSPMQGGSRLRKRWHRACGCWIAPHSSAIKNHLSELMFSRKSWYKWKFEEAPTTLLNFPSDFFEDSTIFMLLISNVIWTKFKPLTEDI